jgi:hypothetical protein
MKIKLIRKIFTESSTIGELWLDDVFFCNVLEDYDRLLDKDMPEEFIKSRKIKSKTAIPSGIYRTIISYSPRFKEQMPLLLNVPAFTGIRVHWGNKPEHTDGCILVGTYNEKAPNFISNSRVTYRRLFNRLKNAERTAMISTTISRDWVNKLTIK